MKDGIDVNYWTTGLDRELTGFINSIPLLLSLGSMWVFYWIGSPLFFPGVGLMLFFVVFLIVTRIYTNAKLHVTADGFLVRKWSKTIRVNWPEVSGVHFERPEGDEFFSPTILMKIQTGKDVLELRIEKNLWMTPNKKYEKVISLIDSCAPNSHGIIKNSLG